MTVLPRPGGTLWWLLFFNSRNKVTSMNHHIRLLKYSLQLFSTSSTLTLCSNALAPCTQQRFNGKIRQITSPDTCPFERRAMGTDVPFYSGIVGDFIVYRDRIETDLLKLCTHPENSEWFSVIFFIIFRSTLLLNRNKHNCQWFVCFL